MNSVQNELSIKHIWTKLSKPIIKADETKKKQTNLAQRNFELEESVSSERSKKRDTENKLKKYAELAEMIKTTSSEKISKLKLKIKQLESELRQTKEDKFNSETKIMLLGMILLIYRYVGIKLQRFFEDILSSRTNFNGRYRVDL